MEMTEIFDVKFTELLAAGKDMTIGLGACPLGGLTGEEPSIVLWSFVESRRTVLVPRARFQT